MPRYPSVPGRLRAKSKPVATSSPNLRFSRSRASGYSVASSSPARPAQRLEMLRLVVPEGANKQVTILGNGAAAASATVDLLDRIGVL